jgi:RNA polymerase sigma-70 factor, ECF subfamily
MNSNTLEMRAVSRPTSWADLSDEELLNQYRKTGVRHAFDELVHRYERELFSYLRRYLGDATLAEDAFQAAFFQVHLKCEQFEEGRKVRPWLYTIATNQAIDAQRRNKRHRLVSRTVAKAQLRPMKKGRCCKFCRGTRPIRPMC